VAKAIAAKVRLGPGSELRALIGGATLSFDVFAGHPLEPEVYGLLADVRARVNDVWSRLAAYNREHPIADQDRIKVTFYLGQNVERPDSEPGVGLAHDGDANRTSEPDAGASEPDAGASEPASQPGAGASRSIEDS
jgi:hypothetical protein